MDRETEQQLVAALRQGDEPAFRRVYDAYRARILAFVLRMVRRRDVAEELAQEVWLRLAARSMTLAEDTNVHAWLFTVARNLCISYWRTWSSASLFDSDPAVLDELRATGPGPERVAVATELRGRLEDGLARLPRRHREALVLVGVEKMSSAPAAEVCGVSPEAMRKRLERARDALAALLGESRSRTMGRGRKR